MKVSFSESRCSLFVQVLKSFENMNLSEALVRGIYAYGFERPSAVQQRAIVPILKGRDVIVQSQSGTGKTCVFCLGALSTLKVEKGERDPQVRLFIESILYSAVNFHQLTNCFITSC